MKEFKIRCSAIGEIMGGKHVIEATETQLKNIATMEAREKPMTAKQKEKYDNDVFMRDNPRDNLELPAGAKTYCQLWHKEQIFKRRKEINGNALEKGNFCEDGSISFLNDQLIEKYKKNEEYRENDFMTGTADIVGCEDDIDSDIIIDMKNCYLFHTMPIHDFGIVNKDYYYQLQGYMHLYGKTKAELRYVLMDMPHHMIVREAKSKAFRENRDYDEVFTKVYNQLTYGNIEPENKYKIFPTGYDPSVIIQIEKRVKLCRTYINELIKEL